MGHEKNIRLFYVMGLGPYGLLVLCVDCRVRSKDFELKINLKSFSSINFALKFIFFICLKFFSHIFMNFKAKSMNGRDFESNSGFKPL
jgi:hypothetical protein